MQATPAQQATPSKQLAACAYWLQQHARYDSAYWELIALHNKEGRKARPTKAAQAALFDGACAVHMQVIDALEEIHRRGGLLFVGVAGALLAATQLRKGAA